MNIARILNVSLARLPVAGSMVATINTASLDAARRTKATSPAKTPWRHSVPV